MKERTQLAYVWFAGHYLHLLLQKLFESVQIREHDLSNVNIRQKKYAICTGLTVYFCSH
jgi:hypothetical protein